MSQVLVKNQTTGKEAGRTGRFLCKFIKPEERATGKTQGFNSYEAATTSNLESASMYSGVKYSANNVFSI